MADLGFSVAGISVERHAFAPTLSLKLRVINRSPVRVQNILLNCQIRIDPTRRRYSAVEKESLRDLFGERHRWCETVHSMLWVHSSIQIAAFDGEAKVDLPVPCSFDFNVASTKYFYGLQDDEVPLRLLFSGTVFYRGDDGLLQMDQISWSSECEFRLPIKIWREMIDHHYPDSAWLRIDRATFDALARFKRDEGLTSWEQALDRLLDRQQLERVA